MMEEKEVSQVTSLSLMTPLPEFNPSNSISERRSTSGCRVSSSSSSFLTDQSMTRKQRRYWSPELHRSFVNAIQQLGGDQGLAFRDLNSIAMSNFAWNLVFADWLVKSAKGNV